MLIKIGIDDFDTQPFIYRQFNSKSLNEEGIYETTGFVDYNLMGSIQPADDKEYARRSEGLSKVNELVNVYINSGQIIPNNDDLVIVGAKTYKVIGLRDWSENGYQLIKCELTDD